MKNLASAAPTDFTGVRFVLTDMDETLTHDGRLAAATYEALERLQSGGIKVIVVTAAPAGWCDQMARMWPLDGVIAENGGVFFARGDDGGSRARFWHDEDARAAAAARLEQIRLRLARALPDAMLAGDQPFRLTSLAFRRPADARAAQAIVDALDAEGARTTLNNLWVLGWIGEYDKLAMARRVLAELFALDIDREGDAVCYAGDSENDAPMFDFFQRSIGMSTVRGATLSAAPKWIARGPGGAGFVEAADTILAARR